jgi:adenylosuccinate synthase
MKHAIVTGLSFGDEGKGTTVDFLARELAASDRAPTIVRHNGGPQAAHHVVNEHGQVHCFSQFGAGMFVPSAKTILSRFMLVEPFSLVREAKQLESLGVKAPLKRVTIDRRAVLVTPYHRAINRLLEITRGKERHGSCGLGVGQAWLDHIHRRAPSVHVRDIEDLDYFTHRLEQQRLAKYDLAIQLDTNALDEEADHALALLRDRQLCKQIASDLRAILLEITRDEGESLAHTLFEGHAIFEGAQGVLLDAERGFFPHVTATCTTTRNANLLIEEAGATAMEIKRLGISRAYGTRHGAGPFPTEREDLTAQIPDWHNARNPWQGAWRVGDFDAVLARYALDVCGDIDALVITNLDRLDGRQSVEMATLYEHNPLEDLARAPTLEELQRVTRALDAPRTPPKTVSAPGWSQARSKEGLALEARQWVELIARECGDYPVELLSVGATAQDKLRLCDDAWRIQRPTLQVA